MRNILSLPSIYQNFVNILLEFRKYYFSFLEFCKFYATCLDEIFDCFTTVY
jgi:hypothetical protein